MRTLVIDDEPIWLAYVTKLGYDTDQSANWDDYDTVIISSRFMNRIKPTSARIVVASGSPTEAEAIKAYRSGAKEYITKDFR